MNERYTPGAYSTDDDAEGLENDAPLGLQGAQTAPELWDMRAALDEAAYMRDALGLGYESKSRAAKKQFAAGVLGVLGKIPEMARKKEVPAEEDFPPEPPVGGPGVGG